MVFIFLLVSSLHSSGLNVETFMLPDSTNRAKVHTRQTGTEKNPAKANFIAVDVFKPAGQAVADLLVLPGWNFSRKRWQNETQVLKFCQDNRYRCIFPEMGVTLYESIYYPLTKLKWAEMPGGEWVKKILIPGLQKKGMLHKGAKNFLLGLSTGGRGVALLALQNPGLFSGGASISGDFNQSVMVKDRLMTALYGEYEKNQERWQLVDNPEHEVNSGLWKMPIYLAHGKKDKVVPFEQSHSFYLAIKKNNPGLKTVFHEAPDAGHDFIFWNSELSNVFHFFQGI